MDKEKSLQIVAEGLACHGAAVYEYEGTRFVAIKNADGEAIWRLFSARSASLWNSPLKRRGLSTATRAI